MNSKPLQKYVGRSGQVVWAGKIALMVRDDFNNRLMIHAEPSLIPFPVSLDYLRKCGPAIGGFFVEDEQGVLSYLTPKEFEWDYVALEQEAPAEIDMSGADFSDALMWLKEGKRVMRSGWNGKGQFAWKASFGTMSFDNDAGSAMEFTDALMLRNAQNKLATWVPSIGDLMAEDWSVYEEPQAPTISDHQHQALEELEQINDKLASLTAFINDPGSTFSMLSTDEQHQLRMKASYQEDYARALKRIADGLGGEGGAA